MDGHRFRRLAGRLGLSTLAAFAVAATLLGGLASARSHSSGRAGLDRAVVAAAKHGAKHARGAHFLISSVTIRKGWAYGDVVMVPGKRSRDEGGGVPSTFLARSRGGHWHVALQGSTAYLRDIEKAPASLVPAMARKLYLAGMPSAAMQGGSGPSAEPQFELPWAPGQSWYLWYGPHNTDNDYGPHPYTSLDFHGGNEIVHAAASGVVYRPCANLVVVDSGGGWETGYYHMPNIYVHAGEHVVAGTPLGTTGTAVGCGGYANGAHVHFSIYHFSTSGVYNVFQTPSADMNGDVIGGWVVHDGSRSGLGYMQNLSTGQSVYPTDSGGSGLIFNGGEAGGGKMPPPSSNSYTTLANVTEYAGPSTSSAVVGSLPNGSPVVVMCQTKGSSVNGSAIWDLIDPGKYIADWYVSTPEVGQFTPGIPACTSSSGGGGGTTGGTGGGTPGGGGMTKVTAPPNGLGSASSTTGLPSLDSGGYDTSFEHQMPWSSLNGNTNQLFGCNGGAYDGQCYVNVSTSTGTGSFIDDIQTGLPTSACYTLAAWFRDAPGDASFSGTLALWALNGRDDEAASVPFTTSTSWQRFLVTLRVPSPTDNTAWDALRGQVYLHSTQLVLNWDLTQWYGPYAC